MSEVRLVPLACPRCGAALPAPRAARLLACPRCPTAVELVRGAGLVAHDLLVEGGARPWWRFEGEAVVRALAATGATTTPFGEVLPTFVGRPALPARGADASRAPAPAAPVAPVAAGSADAAQRLAVRLWVPADRPEPGDALRAALASVGRAEAPSGPPGGGLALAAAGRGRAAAAVLARQVVVRLIVGAGSAVHQLALDVDLPRAIVVVRPD